MDFWYRCWLPFLITTDGKLSGLLSDPKNGPVTWQGRFCLWAGSEGACCLTGALDRVTGRVFQGREGNPPRADPDWHEARADTASYKGRYHAGHQM